MKYLLFALFLFCGQMAIAQTSDVKVSLRNGSIITGDLVEFDPLDHITLKIGNTNVTIPMTEVAYVDKPGQSSSQEVAPKDTAKTDNLANYKGFLLAKGNNVYVYSENEKYETAAKNDLIMYLKKDGFWNVVDDMIDAHFTISYTVDLQGRDKAYISIDSWRSGKSILLGATYTDESIRTNRRIVLEMYNKHIVSIQKKIEKGSVSKSMKKAFTIE